MALQSGKYRLRGIVKDPPSKLSGRGQKTGEWTPVCSWRFSMEKLSGGESETAKQQQSTSSYLLTGHYNRKITTRQRIEVRDKILEISSVENVDMANREIRVQASEVK